MIHDSIIRLFCAKDDFRPALMNPFNIGDFTYASDGHVAIRVPVQQEYSSNRIVENITSLFLDITEIPENLWMKLPDENVVLSTATCKDCDGKGGGGECPDCDGTGQVHWESQRGYQYDEECQMCSGSGKLSDPCQTCHGTGTVTKTKDLYVGTKWIHGEFILRIQNLPDVRIAPDSVEGLKPIPFKFDGGEGLVVPMVQRKQETGDEPSFRYFD